MYTVGVIENPNWKEEGNEKLHQIQGISNYFIRNFDWAPNFIAILTQTGEIIYVDHSYKVSKIHSDTWMKKNWRDERLEHLWITKSHIISMSRNKLYIWKPVKSKPPIHPKHWRKESNEKLIYNNEKASICPSSRLTLSSERNNIEKWLLKNVSII